MIKRTTTVSTTPPITYLLLPAYNFYPLLLPPYSVYTNNTDNRHQCICQNFPHQLTHAEKGKSIDNLQSHNKYHRFTQNISENG